MSLTPTDTLTVTKRILAGDYVVVIHGSVNGREFDTYLLPSTDDRYGFAATFSGRHCTITELPVTIRQYLATGVRDMAAGGVPFAIAKGKAFTSEHTPNKAAS